MKENIKKENNLKNECIKKKDLKKKSIDNKNLDNDEKCNNIEKLVNEHKNSIREIGRKYKNFINKTIGSYYAFLHLILIFFGGFIVIFSNNLLYLSIILLTVTLDGFTNICLHDCPLTQLEEKYLGISGKRSRTEFLQKLGIFHKCNHVYENQLEFIVNIWMLVIVKILLIIMYQISKGY